MTEKFKKDIDLSSSLFEKTATDYDNYKWENDKDERLWVNMYFIQIQLKIIKWILVIIAGILFIALIKY